MRRQPPEHELALRLTLYGQDAIDLRHLADIANTSCSAKAKALLCALLADDRMAHEEEGRAA